MAAPHFLQDTVAPALDGQVQMVDQNVDVPVGLDAFASKIHGVAGGEAQALYAGNRSHTVQ